DVPGRVAIPPRLADQYREQLTQHLNRDPDVRWGESTYDLQRSGASIGVVQALGIHQHVRVERKPHRLRSRSSPSYSSSRDHEPMSTTAWALSLASKAA